MQSMAHYAPPTPWEPVPGNRIQGSWPGRTTPRGGGPAAAGWDRSALAVRAAGGDARTVPAVSRHEEALVAPGDHGSFAVGIDLRLASQARPVGCEELADHPGGLLAPGLPSPGGLQPTTFAGVESPVSPADNWSNGHEEDCALDSPGASRAWSGDFDVSLVMAIRSGPGSRRSLRCRSRESMQRSIGCRIGGRAR